MCITEGAVGNVAYDESPHNPAVLECLSIGSLDTIIIVYDYLLFAQIEIIVRYSCV